MRGCISTGASKSIEVFKLFNASRYDALPVRPKEIASPMGTIETPRSEVAKVETA
jgi:hypothetical protein